MSVRAARWLLWGTLALVAPLPFFLAQIGVVPALRILMLGIITLAVITAEGARGVEGLAAALLFAQAVVYLGVLWFVARGVVGALHRLAPHALAAATIAVLCGAVLCAGCFKLYRDPFRRSALHVSLWRVYE